MFQFFEWYTKPGGVHWKHFQTEVAQLLNMGISHVWLPPAYKGTRGPLSEGYDVYDIYDLGEFDQKGSVATKYGTRQEYIDACRIAKEGGLKLLVDVVLNHMGGAEETEKMVVRKVDPADRRRFLSDNIQVEAYTRFTFPGRGGRHSSFTWDHQCFTGIDHAVGSREEAIYCICNKCGTDWEPLVHDEKGNFDYLILNDIETRNPAVRQELKNWAKWYYSVVPYDGVRLDAVKHMNPLFFNEWLDFIRSEINPDLFALGEYWLSDDLPVLLKYIDATGGRMSLFDAPLHHNFSEASVLREQYDLRNIFVDSLVSVQPGRAVTFVDNHDTQPLQSLEEYTEQWFKPHAYALILLRREGFPCVFYPDVYGTQYSGKNSAGEDKSVIIPSLQELPALLKARRDLAYGEQVDHFDDAHCIAWVRSGDDEMPDSGVVVVLSNSRATKCKELRLPQRFAGRKLFDMIRPGGEVVTVDNDGSGRFSVPAASIGVWSFVQHG